MRCGYCNRSHHSRCVRCGEPICPDHRILSAEDEPECADPRDPSIPLHPPVEYGTEMDEWIRDSTS